MPHCLDNRLTDGAEVRLMRCTSQKHVLVISASGSHFSSTSGGRSVGIVRSRTKGHGVFFLW
jgi:hypothetical protein